MKKQLSRVEEENIETPVIVEDLNERDKSLKKVSEVSSTCYVDQQMKEKENKIGSSAQKLAPDQFDSTFFSERKEVSEIGKPPLASKKQNSLEPSENNKLHNSNLRSEHSSGNVTKSRDDKKASFSRGNSGDRPNL